MAMTARQKNINEFLYRLYQDVSTAAISIECRKKMGVYDQNSFIYGDSYLPSLYEILSEVRPQAGEVFYDLGSGGGRVVLFAALSFPFAEVVGVELLDDLVDLAQKKLKLLSERLPALTHFDESKLGEIRFIHQDVAKIEVKDADVIYIASTCFEDNLMKDLAKLIEKQAKSGARVITCTKSLPSERFKIKKSQIYQMEWGEVTVFFQEKV